MKTAIKTKRIALRLIDLGDIEKIHQLHSLPEVDRYNTLGIPESIEQTIQIVQQLITANLNGEKFSFTANLNTTNTFVGIVGISLGKPKYKSAEIWFKYLPEQWGKGIATEVLLELIDYCFVHLKLHRIEAGCAINNIGSINVLEKAGMVLEGHRRKTLPLKEGWSDNYEYAILKEDWLKNKE